MAMVAAAALLMPPAARAAGPGDCSAGVSPDCYFALSLDPSGQQLGHRLHYFASVAPAASAPVSAGVSSGPRRALVVVHGHPRDANRTFDAALRALRSAHALDDTLVVAPVFQVGAAQASRCSTAGVPAATADDLLWTCASWIDGSPAENDALTSFAALDALLAQLVRQWPGLRSITVAGFSAGAQLVQHYIGFAAQATFGRATLRYVVADPGTWLYFDDFRPDPPIGTCPGVNRWKYGIDGLPSALGRPAAQARARYAAADITYLEAAGDSGAGPGAAYRLLDTSCAALAQGPYRLQRGQAYAAYDRALLAPSKHRQVVIVPGCAHDVACVFPSPAARQALLGPGS